MYRQVVLVCVATVFLQAVYLQNVAGNTTTNSTCDLVFSKIESRLNIASKILDTARREMRNDLNQICRSSSCSSRSVDCNRWRKNHPDGKPIDCGDIYNDGYNTSGIYQIWPQSKISNEPLFVYCDMENDDGGWTVIQRRGDFGNSAEYFYQDWNAYKTGFGHLLREFWIGNDNLFTLTSQRSYQLKVDMWTWEGNSTYATYSEFWVDDEIHNYALHIGTYEGTAGDSLARQNGSSFSTKDRDNDINEERSCAELFKGAWWYEYCTNSNLNGPYSKKSAVTYGEGIIWKAFKGFDYSLKDSVMKIRGASFGIGVSKVVN